MELDWSVDREGDASLVGCRVRNDGAVPRRVRIESRLDAPALPPRRGGVAEAGWDAAGVTAVIDPGERAAFGFAALAEPVEPPVELASVEPVRPVDDDGSGAIEAGDDVARAAVRDLDDHRPPRRAAAGSESERNRDGEGIDRDVEATERDGNEAEDDAAETDRDGSEADGDAEGNGSADGNGLGRPAADEPGPSAAGPGELDAWFAAVEARVERAERLTDADLATATDVVEEGGGLDALGRLDERVAADAERLKAVRDRAAALAERAEESDVPTEALEALA
ncbi:MULTISPECIES: DUF7857 domain-containing protein [Halorubrum]|uniref:DUF8080 domain-containing protein n=1 Tax=Halorubrum sodomense TaxID=35743 RepID=A0A1I6FKJ8_HALSD|nr:MULTISPECIES: hypothetical protein [Halorubrum]TKX54149.1 hypothetical protein EXE42_09165 [Halorubrum sp. SP3]TKX69734.1 hypothetical protein EXE45_07465 [Halorubrum sp. SP9]SFR30418.1 hypothetical protein SAMN04487937_0239 [Halorubrum sodomense]